MSETTELEAVDAALRSGAASATDSGERELQELALALRADSPAPDPSFAADLRDRVESGFPRRRRGAGAVARARAGLDLARRRPLPVLGAAASAVAALAVAGVLLNGGESTDKAISAAGSRGGDSARTAPAPGGGAELSPDAPRTPEAISGAPRRVERNAQLTLAAPERRLDAVADGIQSVAERYRGYMLRSSLTTGRGATTPGRFELRVPASRLQDALRDLSGLATVRSRTESGEDVTGQFVSARDRLSSLRAERRNLLRRLAAAGDDTTAESLRRRLDANAARVGTLRRGLRDLRGRTDYATVSLTLERKRSGGAAAPGGDAPGSTGAAFSDALDTLQDAVNLLVRALGYGIPIALVLALMGLGGRAARRRRREAALS